MQKLQCELCGSTEFVRTEDGFFQCQYCGCKYTVQQAKTILNAQTVELTVGDAEVRRMIDNAKVYMKLNEYDRAYKEYEKITQNFPGAAEGWFGCVEAFFEKALATGFFYPLEVNPSILYSYALKCAGSPAEKDKYLSMWAEYWEKLEKAIEDGTCLMGMTNRSGEMCRVTDSIESLNQCGYYAEKLYKKGQKNAEILLENGIWYCGRWWLYRSDIGNPKLRVQLLFALGRQILYRWPRKIDDEDSINTCCFDVPLKFDSESIKKYQEAAIKNALDSLKRGGGSCPYCWSRLHSTWRYRVCPVCHIRFYEKDIRKGIYRPECS